MGKELLTKQEKKSIEALGKKEVKDYEDNLFELDKYGGTTEAEALIKRYKSKITLTQEDESILRNNVPEAPQFEVLNRDQYRAKGCWKKHKYRNKVEDYFKRRKTYYTESSKDKKKKLTRGQKFALKKAELEARFANAQLESSGETENFADNTIKETVTDYSIKETKNSKKDSKKIILKNDNISSEIVQLKEESDNLLDQYKKDGLFADIDEDPYAMDVEFENRRNEIMQKKEDEAAEQKLAQKDMEVIQKMSPWSVSVMKSYCYTHYNIANKMLRLSSSIPSGYEAVIKTMKKYPLKKDYIVRRAVANLSTAGFMAGINNPNELTEEELKSRLKEIFEKKKSEGSEMIMTEKGFMSTSMPDATSNFEARCGNGIGIEFIILAKKGTPAINVSTISFKPEEKELLICPGTKFKVLDMQLDGDANILYGNEKSWKIYLTTIPESEEGILNNAA